MKTQRAVRYRIYPTDEQREVLDDLQFQAKRVWNCLVSTSRAVRGETTLPDDYRCWAISKKTGETIPIIPTMMCSPYLTALRSRVAPTLPRYTVNIIADSQYKGWKRFFEEVAKAKRLGVKCEFKPPTFKKHHRNVGLATVNFELREKSIRWESEKRFGVFKAVIDFPPTGEPKRCTLKRDVDQWYAAVTYEIDAPDPPRSTKPTVGIDRGVVCAAADSDGVTWDGPRPLVRKLDAQIERAQRQASKKQKGSRRRQKAYERVAKLMRKQRRVREQAINEISKYYALNYGTIVVEDLHLKKMTSSAKGNEEKPGKRVRQKAGLNKAILEQGLGELVRQIRYKAEILGGEVVGVPAPYTSQTCSVCGHVSEENRRTQASFKCVACGHAENADINAAKVIRSRHCDGEAARGGPEEVTRPMKREPRAYSTEERTKKDAAAD